MDVSHLCILLYFLHSHLDILFDIRIAIHFLTATGKICSDIRQEFILLSDVLGLSALVDSMNHPVVDSATEGTVLGPFFTEDAQEVSIFVQWIFL